MKEKKYVAHRIENNKYRYRGFIIQNIGYYPPDHHTAWEAIDHDGSFFAQSLTLSNVKIQIDELFNRHFEPLIDSPFIEGAKAKLYSDYSEFNYKNEKIKIKKYYYKCEESDIEFTTTDLDGLAYNEMKSEYYNKIYKKK